MTFESDAKITEESFGSSSKRLEFSKYEVDEANKGAMMKDQGLYNQLVGKVKDERMEITIIPDPNARNIHFPRLNQDLNSKATEKRESSRPHRIKPGSRGDKIFKPTKQWSPVSMSQNLSCRRLSKQESLLTQAMQTKAIQLKKTNLRLDSVITQPTLIEGSSSMH